MYLYVFFPCMLLFLPGMYNYILSYNWYVLGCLCVMQANSKNSSGCVRLDINLLIPSRIEFLQDPAYCPFQTVSHPLRNGKNTPTGQHTQSCAGCPRSWLNGLARTCRKSWAELNHIFQEHGVHGALTTFGCVEWVQCSMGVGAFQGHHACQVLSL